MKETSKIINVSNLSFDELEQMMLKNEDARIKRYGNEVFLIFP